MKKYCIYADFNKQNNYSEWIKEDINKAGVGLVAYLMKTDYAFKDLPENKLEFSQWNRIN